MVANPLPQSIVSFEFFPKFSVYTNIPVIVLCTFHLIYPTDPSISARVDLPHSSKAA